MEYCFPEKVREEKKSLIREVAERGSKIPGFVSLALGNPASECIPVDILKQAAEEVFTDDPMSVLQYGPLSGCEKLREWIKNDVVSRKGGVEEGNTVLMLTGSGKALGYVSRTLCGEGDEVFVDEFSYPNAINSMKYVGANVVGIPMDDKGMIPEALEEAAKSGKGTWIYLIPNFQNPTGLTMPLERRKEIYEVARKYNLVIYEDDPYGDIQFDGEPIPVMKSFDIDGRVLYAGSFSKTLSAGLRVGYLYGDQRLINKIASVKNADGQDPIYNQKIVARALELIDFPAHIKMIREAYGRKCHQMIDCLKKYCSDKVEILVPQGGMFIWVTIPEDVDAEAFNDAVINAGVGVVKSAAFATTKNKGHAFRLNFSAQTEKSIEEGTQIFGEISKKFIDQK